MNSTVYAVDEYGNEAEDIRSGYVGEFKLFGMSGVPAHCLACDGSEISRAAYPELFEILGTTWGDGDGSTTFNLPDFTTSGAFLRCTGGNAATLGTEQGDAIKAHGHPIYIGSGFYIPGKMSSGDPPRAWANWGSSEVTADSHIVAQGEQVKSGNVGGIETRPVNFAVNICVVYE